jgi:hypothetical protein
MESDLNRTEAEVTRAIAEIEGRAELNEQNESQNGKERLGTEDETIPGLKQPFDDNYFMMDPLVFDSEAQPLDEEIMREVRSGSEDFGSNSYPNSGWSPPSYNSFGDPVADEPELDTFPRYSRDYNNYGNENWEQQPAKGQRQNSASGGCNSNEICDTFPAYPDTGLTAAQKDSILNGTSQSPFNLAQSVTPTIEPVSYTFAALHRTVEVYKKLVPLEVAEDGLLDEILHRFHSYFASIDASPENHIWANTERVFDAIGKCSKKTTELQFTYDDNCPSRVKCSYLTMNS